MNRVLDRTDLQVVDHVTDLVAVHRLGPQGARRGYARVVRVLGDLRGDRPEGLRGQLRFGRQRVGVEFRQVADALLGHGEGLADELGLLRGAGSAPDRERGVDLERALKLRRVSCYSIFHLVVGRSI